MSRALQLASLEQPLLAFGLAMARCVPLAWLVPALGGPALPVRIRLVVGMALSTLCLPCALSDVPQGGPVLWLVLLVRELGVGATMGFVVSCAFMSLESSGRLVDLWRGANLADAISPLTRERASPLGELFLLFATVIFLEGGGVSHLASAMARSYEAMPLAMEIRSAGAHSASLLVIAASAKLIEAALGLAAPALVALLLADLVLGAIGRVSPHLPLYFAGMPLKALLGISVVLAIISVLDATAAAGFRGFLGLLERGW